MLEVPTIKIEPPTRREEIVDALLELNAYDWLVFTSPNGVTKFFEYFFKQFHDMRDLGGARIAAVGPATAKSSRTCISRSISMPDEALAASVAEAFTEFESIENLKICLLRAEVANPELPEALEALGAIVDDIAVYRTVPETEDPDGAAARSARGRGRLVDFHQRLDGGAFPRAIRLARLLDEVSRVRKIATIGPETSKALAALQLQPTVEARLHTADGLVAALLACPRTERRTPRRGDPANR